jgi:hypothetical protein
VEIVEGVLTIYTSVLLIIKRDLSTYGGKNEAELTNDILNDITLPGSFLVYLMIEKEEETRRGSSPIHRSYRGRDYYGNFRSVDYSYVSFVEYSKRSEYLRW